MLIISPNEAWSKWIVEIANDKESMTLLRLMEHLQLHVQQHMPDADADQGRWLQWLAGTYNLLAILSEMVGCHPSFEIGVSRLFQKWRQHPFDHTPPPSGMVELCRSIAEAGAKCGRQPRKESASG